MQKTFPKPKTNHHTTVKAMAQRRHGEPAQNATATNPQDQLPNTASAGENLHPPYKPKTGYLALSKEGVKTSLFLARRAAGHPSHDNRSPHQGRYSMDGRQ
jgi:hypothetical protein